MFVATAKETSSSRAWITGAVATMAEFPQTAVPTPISVASRPGTPASRLRRCAAASASDMRMTIIPTAFPPIASTCWNEKAAPRSTIAARSTVWNENRIPGARVSGSGPMFPTISPIRTAKITSPSALASWVGR